MSIISHLEILKGNIKIILVNWALLERILICLRRTKCFRYLATLKNNRRNRIIFNRFPEIVLGSAFPAASNSCSDRTDGGSGNSNCSFNRRRPSITKVSASLFAQKQLAMTFFSLPLLLFAFPSSRIRISVTSSDIHSFSSNPILRLSIE